MKKWINNFLIKPFGFWAAMYLYYSFFVWDEFYDIFSVEGIETLIGLFILGIIIFGIIPIIFKLAAKLYNKIPDKQTNKKQTHNSH